MTLLTELAVAVMLLTRIRLGWVAPGPVPVARTVWAFPLVGALVGALGAAACAIGWVAGVPATISAAWSLVATTLLTGALHEDGLADTADGFGGGRTRERKLAIMRDSRIGTFGAIALLLSLGIRGAAIAALGEPHRVLIAWTVAGALARGAMIVPLLCLKPARTDGLAAGLGECTVARSVASLVLAGTLGVLLLPFGVALRVMAGTLITAVALARLARGQVGGYTGDVLGATAVITECVALSLLAGAPVG